MMAIILGVLVTISSLLVAFFLAVSNVTFLIESDFLSKTMDNAVVHALQEGDLARRAQYLFYPDNDKTKKEYSTMNITGVPLRASSKTSQTMSYTITLNPDKKIGATMKTNTVAGEAP